MRVRHLSSSLQLCKGRFVFFKVLLNKFKTTEKNAFKEIEHFFNALIKLYHQPQVRFLKVLKFVHNRDHVAFESGLYTLFKKIVFHLFQHGRGSRGQLLWVMWRRNRQHAKARGSVLIKNSL